VRAFVSVMLPDVTRRALQAQLEPVRSADPVARHLRWERPQRWHLTLAFLGAVESDIPPAIEPRLRRAASRTDALALSVAGLGRFGGRVLYAQVHGDRPGLRRLAERTQAAARRVGVPMPDRAFRPHVTLARSPSVVDLRPLVQVGRAVTVEPWRVDEICLVESVLGNRPRYDVLERFALRGTV
jgi:2'-5' RNA ligase